MFFTKEAALMKRHCGLTLIKKVYSNAFKENRL